MKKEYDFSKAKKNPFANVFNGRYTVTVENSGYDEILEVELIKSNDDDSQYIQITKADETKAAI